MNYVSSQREVVNCENCAIAFASSRSDRLDFLRAMIVGPPDTPYEDGFFFFEITIPETYPFQPPAVVFKTSDHRVRFHPNLYVEGKTCLSILGRAGGCWLRSFFSAGSSTSTFVRSSPSSVLVRYTRNFI